MSDGIPGPGPFREHDTRVCRCWNEGQWGRVHREDCPIHAHLQPEPPPLVAAARHIPPRGHLVKARTRLERVKAFDVERLGKASRKDVQSLPERKQFAIDLLLVLRDYERLLDGLLPPEAQ